LDLGDAKAKTAVAQQVIPLIKDIQDPVERDHYWQYLARTLQIDERALRQVRLQPDKPRAAASSPRIVPPEPDVPWPEGAMPKREVRIRPLSNHLREANFLRQCLAYPQVTVQVNRLLQQMEQTAVAADDFTDMEDKLLWQYVMQTVETGAFVVGQDLCDSLDDPMVQHRVEDLKTVPPTPLANLERLPDTLVLSVLQWRRDAINRQSQEIKQLVSVSQETDVDLLQMYQKQAYTLTLVKRDIDKAIASMSALNRRRIEESKL
ncbi:MAG: hypothetical protein KC443_19380, partial [Anaerolineales bacterium]|nr:hypothetical protein [Anaerolineales bacterium]